MDVPSPTPITHWVPGSEGAAGAAGCQVGWEVRLVRCAGLGGGQMVSLSCLLSSLFLWLLSPSPSHLRPAFAPGLAAGSANIRPLR